MANKTVTVRPSGGTYTTLAAAITGEVTANANLVTMDGILTISIEGTWSSDDTTAVNVTGFTTDSTHYVNIITDSANRTGYSWDTEKYILRRSTETYFASLSINQAYTRLTGLQVESAGTGSCIDIESRSVLDSCFTKDGGSGISVFPASGNAVLVNCIAYSATGRGIDAGNSASPVYMYNCVSVGNGGYGYRFNQYNYAYIKNCYSGGNTGDDYNNSGGSSTVFTDSYSEDGTLSTPTAAYSTSTFTNVTSGSEDFSLVSGSALIGEGTDLSADGTYPFDWDITGATRTTWDVGAFYFEALTGVSIPVIMHHRRMQGMV